jgi:hypothetical protein
MKPKLPTQAEKAWVGHLDKRRKRGTSMKHLASILALASLVTIAVASENQAQQCSTRMTAGKYAVVCDGFLTPAPNSPLVPAKLLSVATGDRYGNFTGEGTISLGGTILQQTVKGTEKLNPDCTGTITYQTWINGQPGPPLDIAFFVSQRGDTIDGLATDSGAVFACRLTRTRD